MTEPTRVIAIVGPTASGKARLAAAVARAGGVPLLSCDSMKVYRGMDVGTAKPPPALREGVTWRGVDVADPWESFDARRFAGLFEEVLTEARRAGRPVVLVGGTMLYLKAATEGLADAPPRDAGVRARLEDEAAASGSPALHARLAEVDPATAARVHANDLRRIVRALEVFEAAGRPLSTFQGQFGRVREGLDRTVFRIERERADMDRRIDERVERMVSAGWVEECARLQADPRGVSPEASQALGYRQLFDWDAAGRPQPLDEVVRRIQTATRRFARKQLTWLKKLPDLRTLRTHEHQDPTEHAGRILEVLGL